MDALLTQVKTGCQNRKVSPGDQPGREAA